MAGMSNLAFKFIPHPVTGRDPIDLSGGAYFDTLFPNNGGWLVSTDTKPSYTYGFSVGQVTWTVPPMSRDWRKIVPADTNTGDVFSMQYTKDDDIVIFRKDAEGDAADGFRVTMSGELVHDAGKGFYLCKSSVGIAPAYFLNEDRIDDEEASEILKTSCDRVKVEVIDGGIGSGNWGGLGSEVTREPDNGDEWLALNPGAGRKSGDDRSGKERKIDGRGMKAVNFRA